MGTRTHRKIFEEIVGAYRRDRNRGTHNRRGKEVAERRTHGGGWAGEKTMEGTTEGATGARTVHKVQFHNFCLVKCEQWATIKMNNRRSVHPRNANKSVVYLSRSSRLDRQSSVSLAPISSVVAAALPPQNDFYLPGRIDYLYLRAIWGMGKLFGNELRAAYLKAVNYSIRGRTEVLRAAKVWECICASRSEVISRETNAKRDRQWEPKRNGTSLAVFLLRLFQKYDSIERDK